MATTINRIFAAAVLFSAACIAAQGQEMSQVTCAAGGQNYDVGDVACIPACHGQQQLAKCEQSGEGAAWSSISNSCPSAMNRFPRQSVRSASINISPRTVELALR